MDRPDEKRDGIDHDDDTPVREGDVLGLGGSAVPKGPGDPTTSYDPDSVAQRRTRALEGEAAETVSGEDPDRQRSGATGIDMGSGGQGTHVSGK
jgi:hypothetical protein